MDQQNIEEYFQAESEIFLRCQVSKILVYYQMMEDKSELCEENGSGGSE